MIKNHDVTTVVTSAGMPCAHTSSRTMKSDASKNGYCKTRKQPAQDRFCRESAGAWTDFHSTQNACPRAQEDAARKQIPREDAAPIRLSLRVAARRFRIEPKRKREEYMSRLERIIRTCETPFNNPKAMEKIQLKADEVIIKEIKMSYEIMREAEIENLERLVVEIKAKLEERDQ